MRASRWYNYLSDRLDGMLVRAWPRSMLALAWPWPGLALGPGPIGLALALGLQDFFGFGLAPGPWPIGLALALAYSICLEPEHSPTTFGVPWPPLTKKQNRTLSGLRSETFFFVT